MREHTTPRSIPSHPFTVITIAITMLVGATAAQAATAPVKEILSSRIGGQVNQTTGGNICTTASKNTCRPATPGSQPGGFEYPEAVAVDSDLGSLNYGDVYVADRGNNRVQELTASGEFVSMFGADVDKKGGDVCTKAEENECQAGKDSEAPGQIEEGIPGIAVDPASGDIYVDEDQAGARVQKFTAAGGFVLEIGKKVNEKTKGNLCTQEEVENVPGVKCKAPAPTDTPEPGAFMHAPEALAVGGPEDLLYVGEEHRVQEFEADGKYKGETPLTSISATPASQVQSIAVDKTGDVYLTYAIGGSDGVAETTNVIHEFDPDGSEINTFTLPRNIGGIAIDPAGRLAVIEHVPDEYETIGSLYGVGAGALHLITQFQLPKGGVKGIGFSSSDGLYVVGAETAGSNAAGEIWAYDPAPVGELLGAPGACAPGVEHESDVTLDCLLNGDVDAWGVKDTRAWFQWGRTPSLGEKTEPSVGVANVKNIGEEEPFVKVAAPIDGLRPNETFYDRVAGEDENVLAPELLTSEPVSFTTPVVAPKAVGEPSASFETNSRAVLFGELNPENTDTTYEFQYGACESLENCPGMLTTPVAESAVYGPVATTMEAAGLQPATTYRFRLLASNRNEVAGKQVGGETTGAEGTFRTAPAPVPVAVSGVASAVGVTSATVSGTVNPDGQPATYAFELGVYAGSKTRYGVVFLGSAGTGTVPVTETLGLSGLQPGTTYAYRIVVASGYGTETGAPVLFTTTGLPSVLALPAPLAQLAIPAIAFPVEAKAATTVKKSAPKCKRGEKLAHGKCVNGKTRHHRQAKMSSASRKAKR